MSTAEASKKARRSKLKGGRGEREFAALLHDYGWPEAARNLEQSRDGGADMLKGPLGLAIETKRVERLDLRAAVKQATKAAKAEGLQWLVAHRRNNEEWQTTCDARWLLSLIAENERLRGLR